MRVDWRLISGFAGVGAYFLVRLFGASVLVSVTIAFALGLAIYAITRPRRGGPRGPTAAA